MTRIAIGAALVLVFAACGELTVDPGTIAEPEAPSTADPGAFSGDSTDDGAPPSSSNDPSGTPGPGTDLPVDQPPPNEPGEPADPAAKSDGCRSAPAGSATWELQHDGRSRELRVHIPPSYDPNTPTPVVLNYHGRSMSASQQEAFSAMSEVADQNGFIIVYPEGTGNVEQTWNAGFCCGSAQAQNVDDVGFTAAILDELEANLCIDTNRVYTVGMSNGGFMSHRLGCELADRITAIGAVAGTLAVTNCSPSRPVPVLHFHGTADNVVPYGGIVGPDSAPSTTARWVQLNGCSESSEVYFAQDDVTCERWTGCNAGAEVRLCTIDGGGHTWPGGNDFTFGVLGNMTNAISASQHFWEFFSGHSR